MKFIFFTILIALSNFGYSTENNDHKTHKTNKEHGHHNTHEDHSAYKNEGMHKKHSEELIIIQNPTIKTTPPGINNSVAYFTIINNGKKEITLIDVSSDAAQLVEMHEHIVSNGAMKMQKMGSLTIPAKGFASFQPGSFHIMLIGVTNTIKRGDKIDITLSFDDGTQKTMSSIAKKQYTSDKKSKKHH